MHVYVLQHSLMWLGIFEMSHTAVEAMPLPSDLKLTSTCACVFSLLSQVVLKDDSQFECSHCKCDEG